MFAHLSDYILVIATPLRNRTFAEETPCGVSNLGAMTSLSSPRLYTIGHSRKERPAAYDDKDVVAPAFAAWNKGSGVFQLCFIDIEQ